MQMPAYTKLHWAKADRQNPAKPQGIHLLEHHLADVGACFEQLLRQPTIRQRLARAGGWDDLDGVTAARLAVLAALHDIGKVNAGFQVKIWRPEDWPDRQRPQSFRGVGHIRDLTPVINDEDKETFAWFFPALGFGQGVAGWDNGIFEWDDQNGVTVGNLFIAALSHHGEPIDLGANLPANTRAWQQYGELNPREGTERIGKLVRQWFPEAFAAGAPPLPDQADFQHHFLGLCILADWIGSNEGYFPFDDRPDDGYIHTARKQAATAIADIGLDISKQREIFGSRPPRLEFADLFALPRPNAIQQQAALDTPLDCPLVIIESETGSGKTEAALWRFARMYQQGLVDGLYFALTTRAAASQIHRRVEGFVARMFPEAARPAVVRAVPGYIDRESVDGGLQDYRVWWEKDDGEMLWAAESAKRYLAAQIAVGTVDQAMLGALQVRHAHLRASCLARNLLVVDEVHASDTYMREILAALLNAHRAAGGYALLMSATLGSASRQRWLYVNAAEVGDGMPLTDAIDAHYPAVSWVSGDGAAGIDYAGSNDRAKAVAMAAQPAMHDFDQVAETALAAARSGAKVLVIRNTVGYARQTQQALENRAAGSSELLFTVRDVVTLHHSRFAAADRRLLDGEIERQLGKDRPAGGRIVVGTQTLEQSLDIDADLLITDLCPVDVLLQRIGRLHRHTGNVRPAEYANPQCIVLTPPGEDLSPLLNSRSGQDPNGLGPHGGVYRSLHILEATRRLLDEYGEWRIRK